MNSHRHLVIKETEAGGRWTDGTHRPPDPFSCYWCRIEFSSLDELHYHAFSAHRTCNEIICFICGTKFSTRYRASKHVDLVHKKLRPFRCRDCGKCYFASHDLLRHIYREHSSVEYKCEECSATFRGDSDLRSHYFKDHRCRIKFKGILGPEIEYVLPISKSLTSPLKMVTKKKKGNYNSFAKFRKKKPSLASKPAQRRSVAKKSTSLRPATLSSVVTNENATARPRLARKCTGKLRKLANRNSNLPPSSDVDCDKRNPVDRTRAPSPDEEWFPKKKSCQPRRGKTNRFQTKEASHGSRVKISVLKRSATANDLGFRDDGSARVLDTDEDVADVIEVAEESPDNEVAILKVLPCQVSPAKPIPSDSLPGIKIMTPTVFIEEPQVETKKELVDQVERKLRLYECTHCQRKCANVRLMESHLKSKHGIPMINRYWSEHFKISYLCTMCDKKFFAKSNIEAHVAKYEDCRFHDADTDDASDCVILD